ncbi:DUF3313 domain-containing protein [Methylobacterium sp. BTF04]|uniref:DUF3313 domain-containing protein n=1 Tax=Methylobacterium sp. BTF04 TaxID=2708300 RepID=UPI0013D53890|nr:DUF3313 domain-containing protein [Methylobacterium sp. BTF04]NEU12870.1 DUF3313 domain-containing protein [Methylobacterium sp. BTF04]
MSENDDVGAKTCAPLVRCVGRALILAPLGLSAGCQETYLHRAGSLQSYTNLKPSNGLITKALVHVDVPAVKAARSVRVVPTVFSSKALEVPLTQDQRKLVTNAIDRALCTDLSARFEMVGAGQPADLTVHAVVGNLEVTDKVYAGVSKGLGFAPMAFGASGPVPRLPLGLGSLSVEAEARDARGAQKAAMVWARGAEIMASAATVSEIGDAYTLAGKFGEDFSDLLVDGESPFGRMGSWPSSDKMGRALGMAPKYSVCDAFGRSPGLAGAVASNLGLPPEWSDDGAKPAQ